MLCASHAVVSQRVASLNSCFPDHRTQGWRPHSTCHPGGGAAFPVCSLPWARSLHSGSCGLVHPGSFWTLFPLCLVPFSSFRLQPDQVKPLSGPAGSHCAPSALPGLRGACLGWPLPPCPASGSPVSLPPSVILPNSPFHPRTLHLMHPRLTWPFPNA